MSNSDDKKQEFPHAVSIDLEVEHAKQVFGYLKYLLSISTASLVLISAFVTKAFDSPEYSWLLFWSLSVLLMSILTSLLCYTIKMLNFPGVVSKEKQSGAYLFGVFMIMTWIFMFIGLLLTTIFVITNLN